MEKTLPVAQDLKKRTLFMEMFFANVRIRLHVKICMDVIKVVQ